ncbi:MAG: hypothetical protein KatS3mg010_1749 [Acidimicrobiia bacterium]|nr:MAG: hypothetical protein KatS3mg010_1749 [Acidimicrobiia bacterium]
MGPRAVQRESLFPELGRAALDAEFHRCSLGAVGTAAGFTVAGLFAGIGGIERGLARGGGGHAKLLCERWEPANSGARQDRFPEVPLVGDVRDAAVAPEGRRRRQPGSRARTCPRRGGPAGSRGRQSGLVAEVFRLLRRNKVPALLVLENVRNMLVLDGGEAMRYLVTELEALGYRWAYRLVDSRFTGVPQRRQRVIFVAARDVDPRAVLFADDAGEPSPDRYHDDCFGFYWTEGLRGLGWARDAVPTLKGGSTTRHPVTAGRVAPRRASPDARLVVPGDGGRRGGSRASRAGWTSSLPSERLNVARERAGRWWATP